MKEALLEKESTATLEKCNHFEMMQSLFPIKNHPLYGSVDSFDQLHYLMPSELADFTNETDFSEEATNLEICPACFFNTSGTVNRSKKIPFSDADLERQRVHEAIALQKLNMGSGDGVMSLGAPLPSISGWAIVNGSEATGAIALNSSQVDYEEAIENENRHKVTFVIGTPLVVKEIGLAIEQEHGDLKKVFPNLKTAVIFGDVLPDNLRQFIKDLWGFSNVYSLYGTVEADVVATEDPNLIGQMSLMTERLYFEFIPEKELAKERSDSKYIPQAITIGSVRNGEIGEIIISDLSRETLPLLRYRIGDIIQVHGPSKDNINISVLGRSKNTVVVAETVLYEMQIEKVLQNSIGDRMIEWRLIEEEENHGIYQLLIHMSTCEKLSIDDIENIHSQMQLARLELNELNMSQYFSISQVESFEKYDVVGDVKANRIVLAK
jgi:phenylacetate-coenzyme A ligase PaaK-like adenylate-forming protein